jgi:S1-C subfamily serine protease
VRKVLTIIKCENNQCVSRDFKSAASAFVVKTEQEGSFAITAAHVCEDKVPPEMESKTTKTSAIYTLRRLDGEAYTASVLTYDSKIDVCLLFVKDLVEGVEAVKISPTKPVPGDKIYNISAPIAIFYPNMVPIIEGQYNGETVGLAWYTLMAAPGSSGSMVLNDKGELIGLVHSVYVRFPTITLGARYDDLLHFIKKNLTKYVVYKDVMGLLELKNIFDS